MADLNITKSDTVKTNEGAGQNLVFNPGFESAPTFTAAQTQTNWINGTATGSTTADTWGWEVQTATGSIAVQFDNSTSNSGSFSLKISTTATASRADVGVIISASNALNVFKYGIPVLPSTTYKVTFSLKTTVNSGSATSGAFVRIIEFDSSGASGAQTNSSTVTTTTNWTTYTFNVTAASTANYLNIVLLNIGNNGAGTLIMDAWFDDISIQPISRINGVDVPIGPIVIPGIQNVSGPKIWG